VHDKGVCSAAIEARLDGLNDGDNAGRACWVVPGTLCSGRICGSFDEKYSTCRKCAFYELVQEEEGAAYVHYTRLLVILAERESEECA